MRAKLTLHTIKSAKPHAKPYEIVDTDVRGFLARVQPSGVISYYLSYRNSEGARKRVLVGKHGTITPAQARQAAERLAGKIALGADPAEQKKIDREAREARAAAEAKIRSFGEFVGADYRDWAEQHKKNGADDARRLLTSFSELADTPLDQLTSWQFEKWRSQKLKSGTAPGTVNRELAEAKAALNKATQWGLISSSPITGLKPIKVDNGRTRYLSPDEEARLREALTTRDRRKADERDRANRWRLKRGHAPLPALRNAVYTDHLTPLTLLSLNTGLRRGEAFALQWSDVNLSLRQLTVAAGNAKSRKVRHIPLNEEALKVLIAWRKIRGKSTGLVFPSKTGNKLTNIKRSWQGIVSAAGLKDFVWHDLRHTFASKLVMAGVDLNTVRELLGHSDIKMTLRYAHLAPEHKAAAVALLNTQP